MVLTRNQQSAIQSMAGGSIFRAAGVPDRPGISGGLPAFANGGVMPQLWRNLIAAGSAGCPDEPRCRAG
jgi:hypothetical protein